MSGWKGLKKQSLTYLDRIVDRMAVSGVEKVFAGTLRPEEFKITHFRNGLEQRALTRERQDVDLCRVPHQLGPQDYRAELFGHHDPSRA